MKIKCLIVDDDPIAISILEGLLKKVPTVVVVKTFEDVLQVYEFLCSNTIDFIFLDVEMPNLTGIDFLKSLPHPPLAIITSANKNYALDGFELNAVDYVLKPVTLERLIRAVNKVTEHLLAKPLAPVSETQNIIYLKENKRNVRVNVDEIIYLESIKDYVKVVTKDKTVTTMQSLTYFEEILDANKFLRVHRSFIIAVKHINAYSQSSIEIGSIEITIGRQFKDEILKKLGDL